MVIFHSSENEDCNTTRPQFHELKIKINNLSMQQMRFSASTSSKELITDGLTLPNYSVIGEWKAATAGGRRTMLRLTALVLVTSSTVSAK